MVKAVDGWLFGLIAAPADLHGAPLMVTIALARWAFFVAPAVLVLLWFGGATEDRRAAMSAALAALVGLAMATTLSTLYFEPRPFMEGAVSNILAHAADSGFPSDHATVLFALCFGLRLRAPPAWLRLWILALGLAFAVGWARVLLGVHYPVDILGAAFVAAVAATALLTPPGRVATDRLTAFAEASSGLFLAAIGLRASR